MAARATPRGWHLQFYTPGTIVRDLLPFLAGLAHRSCWIKLSGAYRVAKDKPLSSVAP